MPIHTCHAKDCTKRTPEAMFMCRPHWFMVPKAMRDEIWRLYVPGQEISKTPTREYVEAAKKAIDAVAKKEAERKKRKR